MADTALMQQQLILRQRRTVNDSNYPEALARISVLMDRIGFGETPEERAEFNALVDAVVAYEAVPPFEKDGAA